MQTDVTIRLASVEKVHCRPILVVDFLRDCFEFESELLRPFYALQYWHDEVFVVKEGDIVQARVLVEIPWGQKVVETNFLGHNLFEECVITLLYDALQVGHLGIPEQDVCHFELRHHLVGIPLQVIGLLLFDLCLEPAVTQQSEYTRLDFLWFEQLTCLDL